jgi:hypothetical protein|eukprot:COSAG02_NODE_11694_length_1672_cov_2.715830_2_plen_44_part_00
MQRGHGNVPIEELLVHEDAGVRRLAELFQVDPDVGAQIRAEGE